MKLTSLLEGIGLGALTMFLLDPQQGGRRRALIRDQAVHQVNTKRAAIDVMTRDFANRSRGFQHQLKSRLTHEPVPDDVLMERVRAELGRCCTHSGSIEVMCREGEVLLRGPILATDVQRTVNTIQRIPGVHNVVNELDVYQSADNVPGLQGPGRIPVSGRWTPATCLMMGGVGLFMTVYGLGRRGLFGGLMQVGGLTMMGKAFYDTENRFAPSGERQHTNAGSKSRNRQQSLDGRSTTTPMPAETEFAGISSEETPSGGPTVI
jgi:hypothetical protein